MKPRYTAKAEKFVESIRSDLVVINNKSDYTGVRTRKVLFKSMVNINKRFKSKDGKWYLRYCQNLYQIGACQFSLALTCLVTNTLSSDTKDFVN